MRESFDGLSAMVKNQLQEDPHSGQLFVFINRRQTQMKVLYFDRSGYCIGSKQLVQGQFNHKSSASGKQQFTLLQCNYSAQYKHQAHLVHKVRVFAVEQVWQCLACC